MVKLASGMVLQQERNVTICGANLCDLHGRGPIHPAQRQYPYTLRTCFTT